MLKVDGCGVDRRLNSEMLVDDRAPKNTPKQDHLKDGPGLVRWAETSHSHWFPCCFLSRPLPPNPPHTRIFLYRPQISSELPATLGQGSAARHPLPLAGQGSHRGAPCRVGHHNSSGPALLSHPYNSLGFTGFWLPHPGICPAHAPWSGSYAHV